MARKPLITDNERTIIAIAYNENSHAKAEAIRQIASRQCGRELGLSTVQRELAKLRKYHPRGSSNPLDDQWSLGSLREYPVDTEAIPFLLFIQDTYYANVPDEAKEFAKREGYGTPFMTNRLAIWISRFLPLAEIRTRPINEPEIWTSPTTTTKKPGQWDEWVDDLVQIAMWYSNYEIGCELAGIKPINTIYFDAPTLDRIKLNILLYNKGIFERKGIITGKEPNKQEILESMDVDDLIPKGGKHARPHNKKR